MRTWMFRLAAILMLAIGSAPVWAQTTDRIVAIVNDDIITQGDINVRLSGLLQQAGEDLSSQQAEEVRKAVITRLLEERLILQEAKRLKLQVEPSEVAARLASIKQRAGKEAFEEMLQQAGINEEQLKMKLREQLMVQKAIDKAVRSKIVITPGEVATAAAPLPMEAEGEEEVDTHHLLIRITDQMPEEQAGVLARQIYDQVQGGADFEALMQQHAASTPGAEGGHLGWLRPGALLPELDEVLFALQPGQLSEPVPTRLGFHLMKVVQRRRAEQAKAAGREVVERQLYEQKFGEAMRKWLKGLYDKAYIEVLQATSSE